MTRVILVLLIFLMIPQTGFASVDTAGAICVMNTVTGEIVYSKNEDEKRPMASTTKIMTLITALENSEPEDIVTVSRDAAFEEGSSAYTKPGAKISMNDLCYGLMLNSGNDAAVAIAEHISGDVDKFVELMNSTAKKIGIKNTSFKNPNGLHNDEHFTTASDLAKITRYALRNDEFCKIVSSRMYTSKMTLPDGSITEVEYINHNKLLKELEGCIGVKTGFTKNAGRCLVSAVDCDDMRYIIVTLNDSDDWNTHKTLYEAVIESADKKTLVRAGDTIRHISSDKSKCNLVAESDFTISTNGGPNEFEIVNNIPKTIDFSINKGEKVGYMEIKLNGKSIGNVNIIADRDFETDKNADTTKCFAYVIINLLKNIV